MTQQRLRRLQIVGVAVGCTSFLASLVGGALESPLLVQAGAGGFLLALTTVLVAGVVAWARFG